MPNGRKPTYGAATRLARIVHGLFERPFGWSFEAIASELGIAERTLNRYVGACRRELANWIMSLSPWVEVLQPAELRTEITRRIAATNRRYAKARRAARPIQTR